MLEAWTLPQHVLNSDARGHVQGVDWEMSSFFIFFIFIIYIF